MKWIFSRIFYVVLALIAMLGISYSVKDYRTEGVNLQLIKPVDEKLYENGYNYDETYHFMARGDVGIRVEFSVAKHEDGYACRYKIISQAKERTLFQWDLLSKIIPGGLIMDLEPGEMVEFSTWTTKPPLLEYSDATLWCELDDTFLVHIFPKHHVVRCTGKKTWRFAVGIKAPGPLPQRESDD